MARLATLAELAAVGICISMARDTLRVSVAVTSTRLVAICARESRVNALEAKVRLCVIEGLFDQAENVRNGALMLGVTNATLARSWLGAATVKSRAFREVTLDILVTTETKPVL